MMRVVDQEGGRSVQVIIGVDTHQDKHVAVAIDRRVSVWKSFARLRPPMDMRSSSGGHWAWERFRPSELRARVPMALESPAT